MSNLNENLDEFSAWSPEPILEVLWKIQPFIYYVIPISTTPPNFSSIRRFILREPSDEWINFRIRFSARIRIRPKFMFLYERDIGQPF